MKKIPGTIDNRDSDKSQFLVYEAENGQVTIDVQPEHDYFRLMRRPVYGY